MFAVEVNKHQGKGWEILNGPIPRKLARELAKEFKLNLTDEVTVRIVPTGTVKVTDK